MPRPHHYLRPLGQITRLEVPSLQCVDAVYEELIRIVSQLESKELLRFAVLRERVVRLSAPIDSFITLCRWLW